MSTRNRASYLPRALDSICAQTYRDYALYVLDDASTDDTANILEQYRSKIPSLTVLRNEQNQGTTKNAKRLIELSTGDFIARLDDDDLWLPEKLEKQVQFLQSHKTIWLLGTAIQGISSDNTLLAPLVNATDDADIRRKLLKVNQFAQSSILMRREAYLQVGGYDIGFTTEDYELWLRIGSSGWKLANLPDILTYIWVTEWQISEKKRRRLILSEIRALWKYKKYYPGGIKASIAKFWALLLPQQFSGCIGKYLRKYFGF